MNEDHAGDLRKYVTDLIALERDIANAIRAQVVDERIRPYPALLPLLREVVEKSEDHMSRLKAIDAENAVGAAAKEAVTAVAGTLSGIFGMLREHPVSRMVRDDLIALNVASISYAMLYTYSLAAGHSEAASIALTGLRSAPPLIVALTDLLPEVVAGEMADDAPLATPAASQIARAAIRDAWNPTARAQTN